MAANFARPPLITPPPTPLPLTSADYGAATVGPSALTASVAGSGLAGGAGTALSVGVDDSGIEISGDALRLKAAGVTFAKLAAGVVKQVLTGGTLYAAASAQATEFLALTGGPTLNGADPWTTEAAAGIKWPVAGTFDQLRVLNKTATPATSVQAFTLRVASADTALTCSIPGGTAVNGGATDLVNTATVAAGDLVAMEKTTTVANGTKDHVWALRFSPSA